MEENLKPDYKLKKVNLEKRKFETFDLKILFENINYDMLYLRFFGLQKSNRDKLPKLEKEITEIKEEIIKNGLIIPKGISKVFRASSLENSILVKDDNGLEIDKIDTIKNANGISISDFVSDDDYIGLTSVSIFLKDDIFEKLLLEKKFSKLYIINSLAIMMAESFTEVFFRQVMVDFGIENIDNLEFLNKKGIGKRYSPGYPSLDISVNKKIYELLKANEIGSKLTESFMIDPESSVQSLIIHNHKAFQIKYL